METFHYNHYKKYMFSTDLALETVNYKVTYFYQLKNASVIETSMFHFLDVFISLSEGYPSLETQSSYREVLK